MTTSEAVIEILSLNLKPGTRNRFQQIYVTESLPLLRKWKIQVVAHGPSQHDEGTYYVIRAFKNLDDRQKLEDDFYASDDWRQGPREAILDLIESSATLVVPAETFEEWASVIAKQSDR